MQPYLPWKSNQPPIGKQFFQFDGIVTIQFSVVASSSNITLNSHKLNLTSYSLQANGANIAISNVIDYSWNQEQQMLIFMLNDTLHAGMQCTITVQYTGIMGLDYGPNIPIGFFPVSYMEYGSQV